MSRKRYIRESAEDKLLNEARAVKGTYQRYFTEEGEAVETRITEEYLDSYLKTLAEATSSYLSKLQTESETNEEAVKEHSASAKEAFKNIEMLMKKIKKIIR